MKLSINDPLSLCPLDPEDTSVSEAIYTIYKNDDNWMLNIDWNGHLIRLDGIMISQIYKDVVNMLTELESGSNSFKVFFLDAGLTAEWRFLIKDKDIQIEALWTTVSGTDDYEKSLAELRKDNVIITDKIGFINQWENLLRTVKKDLLTAGYNNSLEDFDFLKKL